MNILISKQLIKTKLLLKHKILEDFTGYNITWYR